MAAAITEDRLIRLPEVIRATGLSKSTIRRLCLAGQFPAKRKLMGDGPKAPVAWSANEVQAWIDQRKNPANDGEEQ
ncbi:helix-turn-helix transcriptional regulator [Pseudomonas sp. SP16.1]|uniref:helix-turn-helix transcriptional regulator n=1 Tax=Pseudomonas sp. SP16.1 TaxID=3458854 RepID=UPI0040457868